jgi:leader peptidase (prepilin peptidase)/N-methyltransferase
MADWIFLGALFSLGSTIGSFLNVCIVRIPEGMSIVLPPSHCPSCKKPIPFYCNIPLVSYIVLGGRCKFCKIPIPFRYFIVELLTPVLFLVLFFFFGLSFVFLVAFLFTAALIVVTFIDLKLQIIPDVISLPGIPICFLCSFIVPWTDPLQSLFGILAGGGVLYVFAQGYYFLTKKEGMGGGDIKLLAMIGAFLGWQGALVTLMLGACAGSIIGSIIMVLKGKDFKYAIPFGPFLAAGAFFAMLFGDAIITFYVSLV